MTDETPQGSGWVTAGAGRPEVLLRTATVDDARAVAEFQTRCWRQAYTGLVPADYLDRVGADVRENNWRERLGGSRQVAVAETAEPAEAGLVGVVSWHHDEPAGSEPELPLLELKSLYVNAGWYGHGVGAALARLAVGDDDAYLWCFEQNRRALAFYAKQGFRPDGERSIDTHTGVPEIRLVRRLHRP